MSTRKVLFILVILGVVAALGVPPISWSQSNDGSARGHVRKGGVDLDLRSLGRQMGDDLTETGNLVALDATNPVPGQSVPPQIQLRDDLEPISRRRVFQ